MKPEQASNQPSRVGIKARLHLSLDTTNSSPRQRQPPRRLHISPRTMNAKVTHHCLVPDTFPPRPVPVQIFSVRVCAHLQSLCGYRHTPLFPCRCLTTSPLPPQVLLLLALVAAAAAEGSRSREVGSAPRPSPVVGARPSSPSVPHTANTPTGLPEVAPAGRLFNSEL
ncbi:hypothetical protein E2C01_080846 [Portunus trituberculatus]|uniref:Uncharacterized protein n=1 Tax=Portunus trituberculatus TaxID=210409 RepID=A0A5B7J0P2_PORTR|nr:hypothetical protein [Portunus trituberculatus]